MRWLPPVDVIRLGHRVDRDRRMTSHLGLTARALGANGMIIFGDRDSSIVQTLSGVSERFGGKFTSRFEKNPMGYLKKFRMGGARTVVEAPFKLLKFVYVDVPLK